ncbi:hemerythrin domain-containing protein [Paenibacillus rigui]|uniref:Hemerythrin-like domain-containing protein n=1 Tax=Paenibacillus rigui TaxID=554312 RepID=A0A229UQQ4_9BACL|nr:hemerythrin domain-containing protein [Paenibacillus rigui]OXM85643.1 hypothetical protein CF651_14765 [Paenibacillus rigui]
MDDINSKQAQAANLIRAFHRLKSEHHCLYDAIHQVEARAKSLNKMTQLTEYLGQLSELRTEALSLTRKLEHHAHWEDNELFPQLSVYFQLPDRPDVTTSLWMLEHEHELADLFFGYFLNEADACLTQQKRASCSSLTDQLLQACRLVKEHLQTEEETVLPLEAELLTRTDQGVALQ